MCDSTEYHQYRSMGIGDNTDEESVREDSAEQHTERKSALC